jgi:hypothetical protein
MNEILPVEDILATMAQLHAAMPQPAAPPAVAAPRAARAAVSVEDFEYETVLEAVETLQARLNEMLEAAHATATAVALAVYYAAEELARDPAHANLIPHVEAMRSAYEAEYGRPIPPRG